jgi:chloramphenicol 3-O-phosphotransferase
MPAAKIEPMKLIFIHGGAAAGKLTVARELASLTGLPLFHNHLVVDAVAAVFPFGSEAFVRLREQFWLATFQAAAETGQSLIFTFAPEGTVAPGFPGRALAAIAPFGGTMPMVRLTIPADEQERRIDNESRGEFGKLRSLELLRQLRDNFAAAEAAMPPADLTIDTMRVQPAEAARMIAERLF